MGKHGVISCDSGVKVGDAAALGVCIVRGIEGNAAAFGRFRF